GFDARGLIVRISPPMRDQLEIERYSGIGEMGDLAILPPASRDQLDVDHYSP
ncbi:MAG: hypothetical protein IH961_07605, partial [Chloroflexi bacterium]|nr:hypothetical protein [Chloroflexota bacterium]